MLSSFWAAQPLISTLLGSAIFWPALFRVLAAFGHPLSHEQQDAVSGLAILIASGIIWTQVSPINKPPAADAVDLTKVGKP